jgi:uncharacterized protein (DUF362 family)/Pyruvate/2-oxoacid:ferredoxin oxidoreductase delta subunit
MNNTETAGRSLTSKIDTSLVSPAFISVAPGLRYEMQAALKDKIRAALQLAGAGGLRIDPGERVALKINLAVPAPPEAAVGTHPELLRATITVLKELRADVVVVEDCEETALSVSGVADVIAQTGVSFLNLRDRPFQTIASASTAYQYAQDLLQAAHLISIPKLKTHLYTYYTGAIKNMFGCIPKAQRRELHREMATARFAEHLVNIYAIRPPDLVIMDGILAMEGIGPTQGSPKVAGLLLIGNDGVLLDWGAAALMGYDPGQIETIRVAMERGLQRCVPEQVVFPDHRLADIPRQGWNRLPVLSGDRRKKALQALCGPIRAIPEYCQRCGTCDTSCPFHAIRLTPYPEVNQDRCQFCFCCLELCPHMAIMPAKFRRERTGVSRGKADADLSRNQK